MFGFLRGKNKESNNTGSSSKYWAMAAVFIVAIIVTAVLLLRGLDTVVDAGTKTVNKAAESFRPKVTIETVISNAIGEIREESKIVVMSADLDVSIEKRSTKRIIWDVLNLGTTTVEFRARDNHVQYVIPTETITEKSVDWNEDTKTLSISIPPPILDESIVEIQSDPDKCEVRTDVGWARFESQSGKYLEKQIRQELRESVIRHGNHELLLNEAARKGQKVVAETFMNVLKGSGLVEDVTVKVRNENAEPHD